MRDIVATIQPEQDVIVRADVNETVCVQGAPGTGNHGLSLWPKTRPSPSTPASRTTSPQEPTRSNAPTAGSRVTMVRMF
jgi:thiamine monophosphate kinase